MSCEQTSSQEEIVEQPQEGEISVDKYHEWSDKSKDIPFKSCHKCIGNGEEKLANELKIAQSI